MLSGNYDSPSRLTATPQSFFQFSFEQGPTELIREIFLWTSNPPENLSFNSTARDAMRHTAYWGQLLKRDFGLSSEYCGSLVHTQNPVGTLRAVYQRLTHLKTEHPAVYRKYKTLILGCGVNFPPLSAIGPVYPAIAANQQLFYLCEAIRLKNSAFAAHILLQIFSETNKDDRKLLKFIDETTLNLAMNLATKTSKKASKDEATGVDNKALLKRIAPYYADDSLVNKVIHLVLHNESLSPTDTQATDDLHETIESEQYHLAIILLQKGATPNEETLLKTFHQDHTFRASDNLGKYDELVLKLLNFIPTHPQLLNFPSINEKDFGTPIACFICHYLLQKADVALAEASYESAKKFPAIYNNKRLEKLLLCLLKVAVISGNLATLKKYEKILKKRTTVEIICFAIEHNQLDILQHFIQQLDKNTLLCTDDIMQAIKACPHKNIVKYLVEEFKLFQLDNDMANIHHLSSQSMMTHLFGFWNALWHTSLQPAKQCVLDLKKSWINQAVLRDHIDVLDYLIYQAPENNRLQPKAWVLEHAVLKGKTSAARYLIEKCGIKPTKEHVHKARWGGHYELSVYLLSHRLDFTSAELNANHLMEGMIGRMEKPNDAVNKVLDWLMSPEGQQRGYQPDDLESHLHTAVSTPLLAWLKAKFQTHADDFFSNHREDFDDDFSIEQFFPKITHDVCNKHWDTLALEAFQFYYQQYCIERGLDCNSGNNTRIAIRATF
jgi:hypothetical protein